jgi:hypothetical protein
VKVVPQVKLSSEEIGIKKSSKRKTPLSKIEIINNNYIVVIL